MRLIAISTILHKSVIYKPGEELPYDSEMASAWIAAGTAYDADEEQEKEPDTEPDAESSETIDDILKNLPNKEAFVEYAKKLGIEVEEKDTVKILTKKIKDASKE